MLPGTPRRRASNCHLFLPRFQVAASACALRGARFVLFHASRPRLRRDIKIAVFGRKISIRNKENRFIYPLTRLPEPE
jgi:hypothetical protein